MNAPTDYIRLRTNPKPETPAAGCVDLFYDTEDGTLKTRDADGTEAAVGGGSTTASVQAALAADPSGARGSSGTTTAIAARKATGSVSVIATTDLTGTTVTVGGTVYTWTAGAPAAPNEVQVGALPSNASSNLRTAIAAGSGGGSANATVDAPSLVNYVGSVGLMAKTAGTVGNSIALAVSGPSTSIIVTGDTLTGGLDAGEALPAAFDAPGKPGFLNPLVLPTPDGLPSVTHPSVVHVPGGWNGYEYWMAMTPWPDGGRELPNILASHDGQKWIVPPGLTNPIITNAEVRTYDDGDGNIYGYAADTHLILLQNGTMACYFIMAHDVAVSGSSNGDSETFRMTSTDGVTWTAPVSCIPSIGGGRDAAHGRGSPAVVQLPDGTFEAWTTTVQSPRNVTRWTSADGIAFTFAQQITPPTSGSWLPWHIDVQFVGGTYHMLVNATSDVAGTPVYYLSSTDGITWQGDLSTPAFGKSGDVWDNYRHYRACMLAKPGNPVGWDVYVSGFSTDSQGAPGYAYGGRPWSIGLYRDVVLSSEIEALPDYRWKTLLPLSTHLYNSGDNAASAAFQDGKIVSCSAGGGGTAGTDAKDGWAMARYGSNTTNPVLQSSSFSIPFILEGSFYGLGDNGGSLMCLYGAAYNLQSAYVAGGTANPFSASKGVGIQVAQPGATGNQKVRIVYNDGTGASESDWHDLGVAPAGTTHHAFRLSGNGEGVYELRMASHNVATAGSKWPELPTAASLRIEDGPTGTSTNTADTATWWMAQADTITNANYLCYGVMENLRIGWPK